VYLAVADAVYAALITPHVFFMIVPIHLGGAVGTVLFKLVTSGYFACIAATSSLVTLAAIAAERYYAVVYPICNVGKLTKRKLKVRH